MECEVFNISNIPAVVYGKQNDACYLVVHGQGGNKFEAERFAKIATKYGYQVLAIDLPKHGNRTDDANFVPWEAEKELKLVMNYAKQRWNKIFLRATSIGVYFSLLAFKSEKIEKCLFVSPLLDMQRMIEVLMKLANVTKERLKVEKEIKTDFGQTLSWKYYCYAQDNKVKALCKDTEILYANGDELIPQETVERFSKLNNCNLTILDGGEHWLHLPNEVKQMEEWESRYIK